MYLLQNSRPAVAPTQPLTYRILGLLFFSVHRPEREVDLSPSCSCEFKKARSCTSSCAVGLNGVPGDKFTFTDFYKP
jgi:hypothetical protein